MITNYPLISGVNIQQLSLETITASRTLTKADFNKYITVDSATDVTITLPEDSTENLAPVFTCTLVQVGVGNIILAVEGSDALRTADNVVKSRTVGSYITPFKEESGVWSASGDMKA